MPFSRLWDWELLHVSMQARLYHHLQLYLFRCSALPSPLAWDVLYSLPSYDVVSIVVALSIISLQSSIKSSWVRSPFALLAAKIVHWTLPSVYGNDESILSKEASLMCSMKSPVIAHNCFSSCQLNFSLPAIHRIIALILLLGDTDLFMSYKLMC